MWDDLSVKEAHSVYRAGWFSPGQVFVLDEYCARYGVRGCHRHLSYLKDLMEYSESQGRSEKPNSVRTKSIRRRSAGESSTILQLSLFRLCFSVGNSHRNINIFIGKSTTNGAEERLMFPLYTEHFLCLPATPPLYSPHPRNTSLC
ncbi:hypothetical protein F7725_023346 [Dissostichus mawsoni]|uniref:Uncharacterized protein n=1 Tax=Dissostichus mawsoni TaxID=36200 RepID=A0A7J5Z2F1_DISMA|nr:hypothetical protein F7725_023346 [Dissostichus mawsoni]